MFKKFILLIALTLTGLSQGNAANNPSSIPSVPSIAAMQNLGVASPQYGTIIVTDQDRGGTFVWMSGSLPCNNITGGGDSGTKFCAGTSGNYVTTGWWQRQFSSDSTGVSVAWFGAKHDCSTDATTAFVAAMGAGYNVFVPDTGSCPYRVHVNSIIVNGNQKLYGNGYLRSGVISTDSIAGAIITVGGSSSIVTGSEIYGLHIFFTNLVAGQYDILAAHAARFRIHDNYLEDSYSCFVSRDTLIYTFDYNTCLGSTKAIQLVPTDTYSDGAQHNLVTFDHNYVGGAQQKIVEALGSGDKTFSQIVFSNNDFEQNGSTGNTNNLVEFTNAGLIGVLPSVSFYNNWFEQNIGSNEIYFRGAPTVPGLIVVGNSFFSTDVTNAKINVDTAVVDIQTNGGAGGGAVGILLGSATQGTALGNKFSSLITNNGSTVTSLTCGINSAVTC